MKIITMKIHPAEKYVSLHFIQLHKNYYNNLLFEEALSKLYYTLQINGQSLN